MTTHALASSPRSRVAEGVYRLADPKITLASVASMVLGLALAFVDGPIAWGWLALTVAGIFCIEAAKNASGEIYDWDSGDDAAVTDEDRSPFSGGKRVLVDGLLTRGQTWAVALVAYGLGGAAGLAIVLWREPRVFWLALVGVAVAFFYHAPPVKLAYRGLGELTVALVYGPLIAAGTYLVQRQTLPPRVLLLGVPLAFAMAAFLWINEFPDRRADAQAGKRTLVVRLGPVRAARAFTLIIVLEALTLAALPFVAGLSLAVWGGALGLPLGVAAARRLNAHPDVTREIVPAQAWTLLSFLLLSLGSAIGLVVARLVGR